MDRYYYLVAQLPMLFFDRAPGITREGFLAEAEKWLGSREYALLVGVDLADTEIRPGDPPALRRFKEFEFGLRSELALWRKMRGTEQEYRPTGVSVAQLTEDTPLEAETRMLRWRWDRVDEEEGEHNFDLELLVLYFLKLQILDRLRSFDPEVGMRTFQNLCEAEA